MREHRATVYRFWLAVGLIAVFIILLLRRVVAGPDAQFLHRQDCERRFALDHTARDSVATVIRHRCLPEPPDAP
jgi:hypothetical protein